MTENKYVDRHMDVDWRTDGRHRGVIGGMWDEIGRLQFDYMLAQGLKPTDRLVDIGCGSFRGGTHFIPYLDRGGYFGFDVNRSLIDAGLIHEVTEADRRDKIVNENFHAANDFAFPGHWRGLEVALSVSLFTHLSLNSIRLCLLQAHKILKAGALYHTTVFEVPASDIYRPVDVYEGIKTYHFKDPFHYSVEDMIYIAGTTGFELLRIREFGHPRGQKMAVFRRL